MLMISLAASAMIAAPQPVQQKAVSPACEAVPVAVSFEAPPAIPRIPPFGWSASAQAQMISIGGRVMPPDTKQPDEDGRLPSAKSETRDPAQALPDCKEEPVKRRKRKGDYPMA